MKLEKIFVKKREGPIAGSHLQKEAPDSSIDYLSCCCSCRLVFYHNLDTHRPCMEERYPSKNFALEVCQNNGSLNNENQSNENQDIENQSNVSPGNESRCTADGARCYAVSGCQ